MPDCGFAEFEALFCSAEGKKVKALRISLRWSRQLDLVPVEFDPLINENFVKMLLIYFRRGVRF